jgi:Protein of unknown function (DUF3485)
MMIVIRIIAALVLIVGAGLVHGEWTNRWRTSPALASFAAKLDFVPMDIGPWKGTAVDFSPRELAMVGAVGYLKRQYTNPSRGITLSVLMLGGLPGNISTHTPDVCYTGAGYVLSSTSSHSLAYGSPGHEAQFQTALATRSGTNPSVLRIYWSWKGSKDWTAPDEPRWQFGAEPALCKLYVVRETVGTAIDPKGDPANDFLKLFIPELDRIVFTGPT